MGKQGELIGYWLIHTCS